MASMNGLRDWWEGITPREQRLVLGASIATVLIVLIYIGLQINDGLKAIDTKNQETRNALEALHNYRLGEAELEAKPKVAIPAEPLKLETYLEEIAKEVDITIPSFNQVSPETKGEYLVTSKRIELRKVTIHQLKDFLHKVETKKPAVVIRNLQIRPVFRDKEKLNVPMLVSTYSKKAEEKEKTEDN